MANNMDFSYLIKMLSEMRGGQQNQSAQNNNNQQNQQPQNQFQNAQPKQNSSNMLSTMMPMLLKNSGGGMANNMLPLLTMLQGGKIDPMQMLNQFGSQQPQAAKTETVKSELDSYTRLE